MGTNKGPEGPPLPTPCVRLRSREFPFWPHWLSFPHFLLSIAVFSSQTINDVQDFMKTIETRMLRMSEVTSFLEDRYVETQKG